MKKNEAKNQRGFIQIPLLVAIIVGVLVLGSGYFGVGRYQSYQAKKIDKEKVIQGKEKQIPVLLETSQESEQNPINEKKQVSHTPPMPSAPIIMLTPTSSSPRNPSLIQDTEPVAINKSDPRELRKVAINQFIENPTVDNFKFFCAQAKTLQGWNTEEVLDSNRQNMVTVTNSLYDDSPCKILDRTDITIYLLPDNSLNISFQDNDSDLVREAKIKHNQNITNLSVTNKFIILIAGDRFSKVPDGVNPYSATSLVQYYLQMIDELANKISFLQSQPSTKLGEIYISSYRSSISSYQHSLAELFFSPVDILKSKPNDWQ